MHVLATGGGNVCGGARARHLRADSEAHNVILTEPALNTPDAREAAAEVLFEGFSVPGLHIGPCKARTKKALGRASLACALEHRLALNRPAHHVVHISNAATHTGMRKG